MCSRRRLVAPQKLRCRLFVRYILLLLVFPYIFFPFGSLSFTGCSYCCNFPFVSTFGIRKLHAGIDEKKNMQNSIRRNEKKKHEFISYISRALETALFVTHTHKHTQRQGSSLWRARARLRMHGQKKNRIVKHNEPVQAAITGASIDVPHLHVLGAVVISLHFFHPILRQRRTFSFHWAHWNWTKKKTF